MKILITGGAGFIGANFVHFVTKKYPDYEITVVDKLNQQGRKESNSPTTMRISIERNKLPLLKINSRNKAPRTAKKNRLRGQ